MYLLRTQYLSHKGSHSLTCCAKMCVYVPDFVSVLSSISHGKKEMTENENKNKKTMLL